MDVFSLALPSLDGIELFSVETVWGVDEAAYCLVGAVVLGRRSQHFGGVGRVAEAVRGFQFVELAPRLTLPRGLRAPDATEFIAAVEAVVARSPAWALWCEHDCDAHPVPELVLDPPQLARRLASMLRMPGHRWSPGDVTFVAHHGLAW